MGADIFMSIFKSGKGLDWLLLALGIVLIASSISVFYEPNGVVVGGFSGIGIIIEKLIKIPVSVSNVILNIPLFIIAIKILGIRYTFKSFVCSVILSAALEMTKVLLPVFKGDLMLVAIYGAMLDGIGVGFIIKSMSSTGGVDLLSTIVNKKMPYFSISSVIFISNAVIIAMGFFVFGAERALYSAVSAFISGKFVDIILNGFSFSKAAFIISDKSDEISNEIFACLSRGVTALNGRGMFTGNKKTVLLCVASGREIAKLKEIVRIFDKNAFVIVTDVKEVMGEGFGDLIKDK